MKQSYIFGGQTGLTYDQIQKQRDIANELLRANMSTPQNVGEGLSAIGRALAAKAIDKRTSRADEANRKAYEARRGEVFGMLGGQGGAVPYPAPSQPPVSFDPNSPQGVASGTMAALGKSVFTPGDRESFVSAMMPHALRVSEMTGLDPRLVIAQAAQETGWGKSAPNNNFFGIKSHGKGGGANLGTFEYVDGNRVNVNDSFRTYDGMGASAEDYARFLMENPRYKEMLSAGDLQGQLDALGRSGYATDPNYSASVGSIANSIQVPGLSSAPAPTSGGGAPAGMPNPAILMALAEVQGDPYASESDKAIASLLMQQTVQAMDPMRQMEMEKARLELDQMRNPQAPEVVTERRALAAEAGLQPGTPEYQAFMANGEMPGAGGKDDPTSVREYQFYAQQAIARGEQPIPYEKFITLEAAAGNPAAGNFTQPVTPGQEQIDKAYAPEYVQWTQGGGADMANQIATVEGIADRLESGKENLTGPGVGSQPDWLGAWTTPNAVSAREDVESVVQRNLRVLLGAQFTQAEGDRLIARAYNPRLPEEENAIRLRRLAKGMRAAADARADQAAYYQKNGTLVGWEGKVWTPSDFENIIDNDTPDVSAEDQEAFKAFAADPSAVAAAQKYGVTLEEMWAIKKGQQ